MTAQVRRRNERLTIGSIVTIVIFLIGCGFGGVKWYKKVDTNIQEIKAIAKDTRGDVDELQKCEKISAIQAAELKVIIDGLQRSVRRLEDRIDRSPTP